MNKIIFGLIGLFPALALAHDPIGEQPLTRFLHFLSAPDHLLPMVLVLVLMIGLWISRCR
jgi:hypothetical protein